MSNLKYYWKDFALIIIVIITDLFLFFKNISNKDFFEMNLYQIISISLIVIVSFYLTQKTQDYRKKKEIVVNIVEKISAIVQEIDLESMKSDNCKIFMSKNRAIDNKITILLKIAKRYNINDEVQYLKRENDEAKVLVSTRIGNLTELNTIYQDVTRHKGNIQNKCDEILFKLYFKAR